MIDNRTTNKNYPLPHPSNIASQDVTRIADAISMIDADVAGCSTSIETTNSAVQDLNAQAIKIPSELVGEIDTELQNIQPRQYVVVNEDATGFSTVEGGGGEGGKKGEVLCKRSDSNFDTTWLDPRTILKKAPTVKETTADTQLPNNCTMILGDAVENEGVDDVPRRGLTQRQINSDALGDSSCSYVLCDTIDDTTEDDSDIATTEKFGRVKIGSGINVNNGTISVQTVGVATANDFGMVKIGDGLAIQNGVLSAQTYPHADRENFGIIKPSADFNFDSNGALKLANKNEDIIYQKGTKNVVDNCTIEIIPTCAYYRAFVNIDSLFSFDLSNFTPKADFSFDLEIVAEKACVISFGSSVIWDLPCAGVNAGSTIIHFEKLLGENQFRGSLKSAGTSSVRLLTPDTTADITENYICGHNGASFNACECMQTRGAGDIYTLSNSSESIWYIDFMRSTYVDYLEYGKNNYASTVEYFYIEGSVDRQNWKRLLTRENVQLSTCTLDCHGYFKHYRIRARNMNFSYFRWYGFDVDDDLYELQRVMPIMQSDSANGFEITSTGSNDGNLYNLTTDTTSRYANCDTRSNGEFWFKYELPEAQTVDLIDLAARRGSYSDRAPTWFKVEGSNDDTNWTTILERAFLGRWYNGESRQYWINSQTPYKFYRLFSIEQPTGSFALSRFRLYKKIEGLAPRGIIPALSSESQAGYEITASSTCGSDHWPYLAFDGNSGTRWASASGDAVGGWIQIKFPVETLCTTAWLTSRNDGWYGQAPSEFKILGSADGINFETLKTVTNQTWNQGEQKVFDFTNTVPYLYYRIEAVTIQNGEGYFALSKVNFGTQMREYRRVLNGNAYLVPVMSANSQDGYVASAQSIYNNVTQPWKAFDRTSSNIDDGWGSGTVATDEHGTSYTWLQVQLPIAKSANCLYIAPKSTLLIEQLPRDFILQGSNDGSTWTNLLTQTDQEYDTKYWDFENTTAYSYYRLYITKNRNNGTNVSIGQFNLINSMHYTEY